MKKILLEVIGNFYKLEESVGILYETLELIMESTNERSVFREEYLRLLMTLELKIVKETFRMD